jgi:hypothetical protein
MAEKSTAPVDALSLTSERPTFDRQAGLTGFVPKLSLEKWDVDPRIVEQRLHFIDGDMNYE